MDSLVQNNNALILAQLQKDLQLTMKPTLWLSLLLFSASSFASENEVKPDECPSPQACISKIYQVIDRNATPSRYPSKPEQAIILKLLALGDDAMPLIVQLLENDDALVARVGAVALSEANRIDAKYLPKIIKGLEKDVDWLAPALAKVGTLEAAEVALKRYLFANSNSRSQDAFALQLFGRKAFPAILKAINCEFGCDEETYSSLGKAVGAMKDDRAEAAKILIGIVEDKTRAESVRLGALQMIGFLDTPGLVVEANLLTLRETTSQFADVANQALIGIKSKHAGQIYADILTKEFDQSNLTEVAQLGKAGYDAGEVITRQLNGKDIATTVLATRALGFIEYTPAAQQLIPFLTAPANAQLSWVAAESLGRMKAEVAIPALKNAAQNHWFPPVRDAAKKAIDHIETGKDYPDESNINYIAFKSFTYEAFGLKACENVTLAKTAEPKEHKLYRSNAAQELAGLAYPSVILSYGANDEAQQKAADPDGIIVVNDQNIVEHRQEIKQVPSVALRVDGGWLAGSNRGEWGGELVYIADNGKSTQLLDTNIEDIYQLGDRYIATAGLAHLFMNDGMIYQLMQTENGAWQAKEWLMLPGAPETSWLVETGEILINTNDGGSILLAKNGTMRMAECK